MSELDSTQYMMGAKSETSKNVEIALDSFKRRLFEKLSFELELRGKEIIQQEIVKFQAELAFDMSLERDTITNGVNIMIGVNLNGMNKN